MASRPTTPATLGPEIAMHIDDLISHIEAAEGKPELAILTEDLSIHYRALGICVLADDADPEVFFRWLIHSALTRRHYLKSVGTRGLGEPRGSRASLVDPLLDAVAARQWTLAADISAASSPSWLEGEEYEDDFCYGDFLRRALTESAFGSETHALLARWRRALEGGRDDRFDVAVALVANDATEFEAAIRALIRNNELKAAEDGDPVLGSALSSDYPYFPNRWVSVEGLALLALAERRGLPVEYAVDACPDIARAPMQAPFQPVSYPYQRLD
jgi:hypothetical protein